nr:hypothetical protein [Tanacetum cinerariifolium]
MDFSSSSSSSDNEVVSCSKACSKAYAQLQSHYHKLKADFRKSQFDVISYQTRLESVEARLLVYQQNESFFEEDIKLLKLEVQTFSALVNLRQNLEKAEQERNDLKLRPSAPIIEDWVSDLEDESETKTPHNVPSFVQPTEHVKSPRHSVQHVETSIPPKIAIPKPTSNVKRVNRKACFMCKSLDHLIKDCDYQEKKMAQPTARNHAQRGNHKQYAQMTLLNPQRHMVPAAVLTQSKLVLINAVRPVSTAVLKISVTRLRQAKIVVTETNLPPKRHINRSPSPKATKTVVTKPHSPPRRTINHRPSPPASNFPLKVTAAKAPKVNLVKGVQGNWVWKPKYQILDHVSCHTSASMTLKRFDYNDALGRSKYMTGNMSYLSDFEEINGGYVSFGENPKGGKISSKGKIRTRKLDFDDVYFVKKLKFNLFSVSQMCDKKNNVLFTDTKCIVLSFEFKLPDENQVLLRVPRENNMYNVDLKNIIPSGDLTCLFAKAILDESNHWHRRLGHINFKTMNKLVKGNLVRGLPSKVFENNHTCVACKEDTQHRASCKTKLISSVSQPLQRSDNGTEFKNQDLNQFYGMKGIKREFSVPRTPQLNGIAERKNKTLIKAARTMLAGSLLLILFWAEAVNSACYVQNRVLVIKPHNKTPYELLLGRTPSIGFMRPFGCHVTILNTLDPLGKFNGKADEEFLVGYFNTDGDVVFEFKEPEFERNKPESEVHVSPSSKFENFSDNSINEVNAADTSVPTVGQISTNSTNTFSVAGPSNTVVSPTHEKSSYMDPFQYPDDPNMPALEDITYYDDEEAIGAEADFTNLETNITVTPIPTTRVNKDHLVTQIIEPKLVDQALQDLSWIEAMQEELLQFKMQKVWVLVDLSNKKKAIGTKWVFRNKKDERGIVVRNKARLVTQGHTQEEGIDYEEVFVPVTRIEAIKLFLAYASFMGCMVYQMDVKSAFLYGTIEEEVYVCQPLGFKDHGYPDKDWLACVEGEQGHMKSVRGVILYGSGVWKRGRR